MVEGTASESSAAGPRSGQRPAAVCSRRCATWAAGNATSFGKKCSPNTAARSHTSDSAAAAASASGCCSVAARACASSHPCQRKGEILFCASVKLANNLPSVALIWCHMHTCIFHKSLSLVANGVLVPMGSPTHDATHQSYFMCCDDSGLHLQTSSRVIDQRRPDWYSNLSVRGGACHH